MTALRWRAAFPPVALDQGEIQVWASLLEGQEGDDRVLAPAERERAARFRRAIDRDRYVARQALLRRLLGACTDTAPEALAIRRDCRLCGHPAHGKPYLADGAIRYSVSASADLGLFAISRSYEVGVDVQRVDPAYPWRDIAEQFWSPHDRARLASPDRGTPREAFFRLWTRKEAAAKLSGVGLITPLDELDQTDAELHIEELEPAPGFAASLAVPVAPSADLDAFAWRQRIALEA